MLPSSVTLSIFPADFIWGVATAAPQIEGAAREAGKGESIWDVFARLPGKIRHGGTLDVACDHYHRYEEDLDLMMALGVKNYRFSIAWPRIQPDGMGDPNILGLDFYQRLIDALLERGITPWVTMFHWDLPQALEKRGGWPTRVVPDAFASYANILVKTFGDRVKRWITLNEITVFLEFGYLTGMHAPGRREALTTVNQAFHHALLCHGHGVRAVREYGGKGAQVGLTDNSRVPIPLTETEGDIAAARQCFAEWNCRVLEPIYTAGYGTSYLGANSGWLPKIWACDFEVIAQPTDFLGMNIYTGDCVTRGSDGQPLVLTYPERYPTADSPWLKWNPRCLYWGPRFAAEVYGARRIIITENGAGYDESHPRDGAVWDLHRIELMRGCLRELRRGIGDGHRVDGYFAWSLLDNFEWADGYARRFGLVHTDFETQVRTPKASASWYQQVMRTNAAI